MKSLHDSFWQKVRPETGEACWLWSGAKTYHGYGYIQRKGRTTRAHRLSWEIHFGEIPSGMEICHRCDKPACVRPDHLFVGTHKENMEDMVLKGRQSRKGHGLGLRCTYKLTPEDIIDICCARDTSLRGNRKLLAAKYGVHPRTIWNVIRKAKARAEK